MAAFRHDVSAIYGLGLMVPGAVGLPGANRFQWVSDRGRLQLAVARLYDRSTCGRAIGRPILPDREAAWCAALDRSRAAVRHGAHRQLRSSGCDDARLVDRLRS